jgi:hypothetical protein
MKFHTVYSFDIYNYKIFFDNWIDGIKKTDGVELASDLKTAVQVDYTTLDWIKDRSGK